MISSFEVFADHPGISVSYSSRYFRMGRDGHRSAIAGPMVGRVAFIGFGEAGIAFAGGRAACGFDRKMDDPASRSAKLDDFVSRGVQHCDSLVEALDGAVVAISLVTADQALAVAQAAAPLLGRDALWLDMNSVAPETKRAAAKAVEGEGARYVDVAVMAPVNPARRGVPLLVCGPHASIALDALAAFGFTNLRTVPGPVGAASTIKMLRSVMIKGIEALTAECMLAAAAAGMVGEVLDALGDDWPKRADDSLDRMMVHGVRRAAEMAEVAATLRSLGCDPVMTQATLIRQADIGARGIAPPTGLLAKLAVLDRATGETR